MTAHPKLRVITGVPGSGKTTASGLIGGQLDRDWSVIHADDFIGPTFGRYPGRQWAEIRQFHPIFAGQSAGWNLAVGRNVLVEGHLKDRTEIDNLFVGVRALYPGELDKFVVFLDGDVEEIVNRLTANPLREPSWTRPERPLRFRYWITAWGIDPGIADRVVDGRGKSPQVVAREVAAALGITVPF